MNTVTLQRMTAAINQQNKTVYTPSKLAKLVTMSYREFLGYADNPRSLPLETGEIATGYNLGQVNHWYIVVEQEIEPEFEPVIVIRK